jgi:hypothetical protein
MSYDTLLTTTPTTNHQPTWKRAAHVKHMTRSNLYLPMAAIVLTVALAVPATAQNRVPFKGTMQGDDIDTPGPAPLPPRSWSLPAAPELARISDNSHSPNK